ncbi:hypothetical protein D516_2455 [Rhodobacter sp. AKP1]|nr:hypothetical protein D516_2455 [Rhodobacter sp. AKP1]
MARERGAGASASGAGPCRRPRLPPLAAIRSGAVAGCQLVRSWMPKNDGCPWGGRGPVADRAPVP